MSGNNAFDAIIVGGGHDGARAITSARTRRTGHTAAADSST
ncbi:MAG TPA: hypothetical protein VFE00_00890 [Arthrobacter sp.]|nr:hypothetical protein [Arthrobacter sp.]